MQKQLFFKRNFYSFELLRLSIFLFLAVLTVVVARIPTSSWLKPREAARSFSADTAKRSPYIVNSQSSDKPYALPPEDPRVMAALSGNAKAQAELGVAYARGEGVQADYLVASTWLILAKANGDPGAGAIVRELTPKLSQSEIGRIRWNLGEMYANGFGVQPDKVTAYMWHCVAETAGEDRSKDAISRLASTMTSRELWEAKRRAALWLREHGVPTHVACLANGVRNSTLRSP